MDNNMQKYRALGSIRSTPNAKLIYAFLSDNCNSKGAIKVSHRELSNVLGVAKRTVSANMRRLKTGGYIRIESTHSRDGGRQANRYQIL